MGELSNHQREVEDVGVQLFQWEEVVEAVHVEEVSDCGLEELVEVGQGWEEGPGLHEVEGLQVDHLGLGEYSEMEDLFHL